MMGHLNTKHGNIKQALLQLKNSLYALFFSYLCLIQQLESLL